MAGIRLEFAQFGDFDSFDIIRSTSSMANIADTDLPSPMVTGLKTMYWVDTNIIEGMTYYYKARVWRDSVSVVSDEILVLVGNYHIWLEFSASGIVKKGTSSVQFNNSGCSFEQMSDGTYAARFQNANTYLYSGSGDAISGDFEIEVIYTPLSNADPNTLYDSRTADFKNGQLIGYGLDNLFFETRNSSGVSSWGGAEFTNGLVALNKKHKIKINRIGSTTNFYLDDTLITSGTDSQLVNAFQNIVWIGRVKDGNSSYYLNGYLHRWSIRKL